jgi:hypothetical protein
VASLDAVRRPWFSRKPAATLRLALVWFLYRADDMIRRKPVKATLLLPNAAVDGHDLPPARLIQKWATPITDLRPRADYDADEGR